MKNVLFAATLLLSCAPALKSAGFPPEALRKEPPKGVAARAVAVGEKAPPLDLESTRDGFQASNAIREGAVVLVFFRGTW